MAAQVFHKVLSTFEPVTREIDHCIRPKFANALSEFSRGLLDATIQH